MTCSSYSDDGCISRSLDVYDAMIEKKESWRVKT